MAGRHRSPAPAWHRALGPAFNEHFIAVVAGIAIGSLLAAFGVWLWGPNSWLG